MSSIEAEATDVMFRIVLEGTEYFFRALPGLAKGVTSLFKAGTSWLENRQKGTVPLKTLVRTSPEGLSAFLLPSDKIGVFREAANNAGIQFTVMNPVQKEGDAVENSKAMVVVNAAQAELVNSIIKLNNLTGVVNDLNDREIKETTATEVQEPVVMEEVDESEIVDGSHTFLELLGNMEDTPENPTQEEISMTESPSTSDLKSLTADKAASDQHPDGLASLDQQAMEAASQGLSEKQREAVMEQITQLSNRMEPGKVNDLTEEETKLMVEWSEMENGKEGHSHEI